jgi:diguanylate cyclase (GGDEF)-like protein
LRARHQISLRRSSKPYPACGGATAADAIPTARAAKLAAVGITVRASRVLLAAGLAAGAAVLTGPGGWWLALPAGLWVAAEEPTARDGAFGAVVVLAVTALVAPPALSVSLLAAPLSLGALVWMRRRLERQRDVMRRFALRDPLTGLCNRRALDDRLRHEVARHTRAGARFAVLALDLDGFKPVNDRFGHDAGDEILREVAHALIDAVRAQDTVARLGGDEFCIVAPDTDPAGALHLEARVLHELASITTGVSGLSACVGIATFPDDASAPAGLLAVADRSVVERKRRRYAERRRQPAA